MRLHEFILKNREQILSEWETFAATCAPASITMNFVALRDHAGDMLLAIAADLETQQGKFQQSEKSKGRAPEADEPGVTAAEMHGAGRAKSGFSMVQMVAEYRALRASVLRLWAREPGGLELADVEDMIRFNEAIDQSLAESVAEYCDIVETSKEMFLAILGHDLRNPLGAIYTSALLMSESAGIDEFNRGLVTQVAERAMRATQMVGDLLDFTRSRLGSGIPVHRAEVELRKLVRDVADEVMAAHPAREVVVEANESQLGHWDAARISQALTNLVANAIEHGASDGTVTVTLDGSDSDVAIRVHNRGTPIAADRLNGLFNPMKLSDSQQQGVAQGPCGHLGLGLYIAERIVSAHGGRIEVDSSMANGTTFSIQMSRAEKVAG